MKLTLPPWSTTTGLADTPTESVGETTTVTWAVAFVAAPSVTVKIATSVPAAV